MPAPFSRLLSSGDLVADRRLELARDYAGAGEAGAAAELMEQALELVPGWAAGWFALGEFREAAATSEAGAIGTAATGGAATTGAAEAYREALRLDPDDRCGATLRLALLGAGAMPEAPPPAHVRDLFDGYADRFEASLVATLGYRGPEMIERLLDAHVAGRRFAAALDLGCGTGLLAPVIRTRVDRLDGVDLAPAMIARARVGGLYDGLEVGDAVAAMAVRGAASLDLITAADVFCYLGDLSAVFAAAARVAAPGAVFAFTTEAVGDDEVGDEVVLRTSRRWAHRASHLERVAAATGFDVVAVETTLLRRDRGTDIPGHAALLVRRRAGHVATAEPVSHDREGDAVRLNAG
ncbi:class I SAM-dependent DNA methyltransferase [Pinisolibacter sp.]|uniref:class I SAM-dependent DNA methyltransferase n=1 Tax=Pinisolibacter sp. TaxID=2172024 RepID=UPI002FDD65E4